LQKFRVGSGLLSNRETPEFSMGAFLNLGKAFFVKLKVFLDYNLEEKRFSKIYWQHASVFFSAVSGVRQKCCVRGKTVLGNRKKKL